LRVKNRFKVIKSWKRQVRKYGNSYYLSLPSDVVTVLKLARGDLKVRVLLTDQGVGVVPYEG